MKSVLHELAMAVGQLWVAAQNWLRRRQGLGEIRRIATLDQIAVGHARVQLPW